LCYTNIVDKFSRSGKFTGIFQPTLPPFKSYCYYITCTMYNIYPVCIVYFCLIILMLAYICFPPSLRGNFCNTKFVYDFVVFSFECHLMYQWQFLPIYHMNFVTTSFNEQMTIFIQCVFIMFLPSNRAMDISVMCILIINAKIWTTSLLFVEQCMHLVYQEIHLKPFLYMWSIKRSKNRKHYFF
jgi:quinol-cytochrome oxidoreductase complex cytochrome b subunit